MTVTELLKALGDRGLGLRRKEDDVIEVAGDMTMLTPTMKASLKALKPDILALLPDPKQKRRPIELLASVDPEREAIQEVERLDPQAQQQLLAEAIREFDQVVGTSSEPEIYLAIEQAVVEAFAQHGIEVEARFDRAPEGDCGASEPDWWGLISDEDRDYIAVPREPLSPCPWCGGRLHHSEACQEQKEGWTPKMTFGKHKGKRVDQVPVKYLRWLVRKNIRIRHPEARAIAEQRAGTFYLPEEQ